eukprot:GHVS01050257.1.p1 GENE.GHVS01050257.1~~GHVS01050257.1.p1  ORF type:complete len:739 (-),score=115.20 GHVS01050257.1:292-2508(-)
MDSSYHVAVDESRHSSSSTFSTNLQSFFDYFTSSASSGQRLHHQSSSPPSSPRHKTSNDCTPTEINCLHDEQQTHHTLFTHIEPSSLTTEQPLNSTNTAYVQPQTTNSSKPHYSGQSSSSISSRFSTSDCFVSGNNANLKFPLQRSRPTTTVCGGDNNTMSTSTPAPPFHLEPVSTPSTATVVVVVDKGTESLLPTPPAPPPPDTHIHDSSPGIGGAPEATVYAVAGILLSYCLISLSVVYFNYWLFTGSFRHPVFVSCVQQFVGLFIYCLLSFALHLIPPGSSPSSPQRPSQLSADVTVSPKPTAATTPSTFTDDQCYSLLQSPIKPTATDTTFYRNTLTSCGAAPCEMSWSSPNADIQTGGGQNIDNKNTNNNYNNSMLLPSAHSCSSSYDSSPSNSDVQTSSYLELNCKFPPNNPRRQALTFSDVRSSELSDDSCSVERREWPLVKSLQDFFPFEAFHLETCWRVLPLAVCFVGMVAFSNLCLKYTQVSTYQVARSMTLLFTVGFSFVVLGQRQSFQSMAGCCLIVIGFFVGSLDSSTLSFLGVSMGVCSSAFQAAYNVVIKTTLNHVGNRQGPLLFYNLLTSSLLFIPVIWLAGEGWVVTDEVPWNPTNPMFWDVWPSLWLSGLLSTMMNLSAFTCVKVTSPVTFNIAGKTKACFQSLGGIVFFGDYVTTSSMVGICSCLLGSTIYSHSKFQLSSKKPSNRIIAAKHNYADLLQEEDEDVEERKGETDSLARHV